MLLRRAIRILNADCRRARLLLIRLTNFRVDSLPPYRAAVNLTVPSCSYFPLLIWLLRIRAVPAPNKSSRLPHLLRVKETDFVFRSIPIRSGARMCVCVCLCLSVWIRLQKQARECSTVISALPPLRLLLWVLLMVPFLQSEIRDNKQEIVELAKRANEKKTKMKTENRKFYGRFKIHWLWEILFVWRSLRHGLSECGSV